MHQPRRTPPVEPKGWQIDLKHEKQSKSLEGGSLKCWPRRSVIGLTLVHGTNSLKDSVAAFTNRFARTSSGPDVRLDTTVAVAA